MFRALAAVVVLACCASATFAQVIYQPVQSQFVTPYGQVYHYGGVDGRVHQIMHSPCRRYGYATNLHRFDGGNSFGQPSPMYDRTPVFTDCIPFRDASRFGYNAADAHNEAAANAARYFRKADQLDSGIVTRDGALIVPATAAPAYAQPRQYAPTTMPKRGNVIIIPRNLLDRPLKDFQKEPVKVAAAK